MSVQIITYQNLADKQRKGYTAVSLDSLASTTAVVIKAGSEIEVAGALYEFQADEVESGGTWAGIGASNTVYLYIVPAGSSATFIYSPTAPTWDTAKQGWYNGTSRCIAFLYKDAGGLYQAKNIVQPAIESASLLPSNFPYPQAAPDVPLGRLRHLPLNNTTSRLVTGGPITPPAVGSFTAALQIAGLYGVPIGAKSAKLKVGVGAYIVVAGNDQLTVAFSDNNSNLPTRWTSHPIAMGAGYCGVTGQVCTFPPVEIDVPLNSSGQCYMATIDEYQVTVASSYVYVTVVSYNMGD